ncbi:MAG: two-component regulator propeller domain-containing protein, partial [Bacteroidota bacterium]
MSEQFIYTLNQDEQGYLLIGTGEGLYTYDGFEFTGFKTQDGLASKFITSSISDDQGSVWYGHFDGGISCYRDGSIQGFDLGQPISSKIVDLHLDLDGSLWILSQTDGVVKREKDGTLIHFAGELLDAVSYCFAFDRANRIFVGTDLGLVYFLQDDYAVTLNYVESTPMATLTELVISKDQTKISACFEGEGIFDLYLDKNLMQSEKWNYEDVQLDQSVINHLFIEKDIVHVCTNQHALCKLTKVADGTLNTRWTTEEELGGAQSLQTYFVDREHNVWIATRGAGLLKLSDEYLSYFQVELDNQPVEITCMEEQEMGFLLGSKKGLMRTGSNPAEIREFMGVEFGLPEDNITSILEDNDGTIWVGTSYSGLYHKAGDELNFSKFELAGDNLNNRINDLLAVGSMLYVATDFGIYQIRAMEVLSHLSIHSGLPHNVIRSLYKDSTGRIWIGASKEELTYIEEGILYTFAPPTGEAFMDVLSFGEDQSKRVWIGTEGSGLVGISDRDTLVFNTASGLVSNYCYGISADKNNQLWVTHRGGLSRIDLESF